MARGFEGAGAGDGRVPPVLARPLQCVALLALRPARRARPSDAAAPLTALPLAALALDQAPPWRHDGAIRQPAEMLQASGSVEQVRAAGAAF
eukprot:15464602-Alexandrium_andersonii.AAC.1